MRFFFPLFLLVSIFFRAQVVNKTDGNVLKDTLIIDSGRKDSMKIFRPTVQDYKWLKAWSAAKIFDTALTREKTFVFSQYNNHDNFGRMQFANVGAGYNPLTYEFHPASELELLPVNKIYNLVLQDSVKYYDVKTPTTIFKYHSAVRKGAVLSSTYTQNFGKNLNLSAEYEGLRSQGFYANALTSNNHVLLTGHYAGKDLKYEASAHFLNQNVNAQENGGIADLEQFYNGDNLGNRGNLTVNLNSSDSRFNYRRFWFSHRFSPFDAEKLPFKLQHSFSIQNNKYTMNLPAPDAVFFGEIVTGSAFTDFKFSKNLSNTLSLVWDNPRFYLDAGARYQNIKFGNFYGQDTENRLGLAANLKINLWEKLNLTSSLEISNGQLFGSFLASDSRFRFSINENYQVDAHLKIHSAAPSLNWMLNSSPVLAYNWKIEDYQNQTLTNFGGSVGLKWFNIRLMADVFRVGNLAYFNAGGLPEQASEVYSFSRLGGDFTLSWRKFHLNGHLLFQKNISNGELYPVPDFIGRANVYYQTKAFKNAAEIQGGLKSYFFSKFTSREFSPILNEYILPGEYSQNIGGQPVVDAYINLKVKTMTFYIEGQQVSTFLGGNKVFAAPRYPLYDFRLNIGIVWYIFS